MSPLVMPTQPRPAYACRPGRNGCRAPLAHRKVGIPPQGRRNHRRTYRPPPGTRRTARTCPPGIYTLRPGTRYIAPPATADTRSRSHAIPRPGSVLLPRHHSQLSQKPWRIRPAASLPQRTRTELVDRRLGYAGSPRSLNPLRFGDIGTRGLPLCSLDVISARSGAAHTPAVLMASRIFAKLGVTTPRGPGRPGRTAG
jgi:hypothetical protein